MKRYATISADIVGSTSLSHEELIKLTQRIKLTLVQISEKYQGFWGRLVKGDSIECLIDDPNDALRIALLLKTLVKSFVPSDGKSDADFRRQGLRLAIGIGRMWTIDKKLDMMDGEAIYLSGRALANMRSRQGDSFQIVMSSDNRYNSGIPIIAKLLNRLINEATSRQCETLYYRLQCDRDVEVADKMNISRAGANNNLRCVGWDVISSALDFFKQFDFGYEDDLYENVEMIVEYRVRGLDSLAQGDIDLSQSYLTNALSVCLDVFGAEHQKTAELYMDLMEVYLSIEDYKKAIDNCKKALAIYRKRFGDDDPMTVETEMKLTKARRMLTKTIQTEEATAVFNYYLEWNNNKEHRGDIRNKELAQELSNIQENSFKEGPRIFAFSNYNLEQESPMSASYKYGFERYLKKTNEMYMSFGMGIELFELLRENLKQSTECEIVVDPEGNTLTACPHKAIKRTNDKKSGSYRISRKYNHKRSERKVQNSSSILKGKLVIDPKDKSLIIGKIRKKRKLPLSGINNLKRNLRKR